MIFLFILAWQQLKARPWQSFLLVLSVSLGVCILTTALSLTNGFEKDMVDRLLGTTPHLAVYDPFSGSLAHSAALRKKLLGRPNVVSVMPFIQGQGLLATDPAHSEGVMVWGVDPALEKANPSWNQFMREGSLHDADRAGVVLGDEVARRLDVGLGDSLTLLTGLGAHVPVRVTGLFASGLHDFDAHVAFITLPDAQKLFGLGSRVSGLAVRLKDVFQAPQMAKSWSDELLLGVRPWTTQNRPLLEAMAMERVVIFIVILFIVLVAMIGVGSTMAMWVIEKNREISLLRAVGVSARHIGWMFVLQGALISGVGICLGSLGGFVLSLLLTLFPIGIRGEVYFISKLPVHMEFRDFALVALVTLLLSPIASLLPAHRAMRVDPIEVIRRT